MFDIGWSELLVLAVVAIIVVGPKDLPRMLRSLGRIIGQLKRTAGEFRSQFDEALRETELQDLKNQVEGVGNINPLEDIKREVTSSLEPLEDIPQSIENAGKETNEPHEDFDDPGAEWDEEAEREAEGEPLTEAEPVAAEAPATLPEGSGERARGSVVERAAAAAEHAGESGADPENVMAGNKRGS